MPRRIPLSACVLLLLAVPTVARADAGTPLMWAGMLHLVFFNFLIGLLEAFVLVKIFHLPKLKTQAFLIPANYFSMIVGWLLLRAAWSPLERLLPGQAPIYKGADLLIILGISSWLVSIVLEWPFCALAMRNVGQTAGRSLWQQSLCASAIAQTTSYALLVPFYLLISPISLYTGAKIEHNLHFVKPPLAVVYYISPNDGAVWRIFTDGTGKVKVLDAHIRDDHAVLCVSPNADGSRCNLGVVQFAHPNNPWSNDLKRQPLLFGLRSGFQKSSGVVQERSEEAPYMGFGRATDLRPEKPHDLTVSTDYWAESGISVNYIKPPQYDTYQDYYSLAFETPFEDWPCRSATVLPGDQVVFQLGTDRSNSQIMILDMKTRQLGFLALGHGPVVVILPS